MMRRYNYRAKDKNSVVVVGEVEAQSEIHAAKLIRQRGLVVISITSRFTIGSIFSGIKDRISKSDISLFTRQLATMVGAGLPITESLLILRNQAKPALQKVVAQIMADVESGEALSKACSKHPSVFSTTYVALLKSGEVGGVMDKVLISLANNLEKDQEFRAKVKGALIYPIIIVSGMIIVSLGMVIFVIPRMMTLYTDMNVNLPLPTKILMAVSSFILKAWPLVIAFLLGGIYLFKLYRDTPVGRRKTDEMIFKIPIVGELSRQILLTDITRTLSMMTSVGVSILDGLNITSGVVKNSIISDALRDAARQVEKGFPIAYSFALHPEAFPYILSQMIAVGEETGKTDEILDKLSHIFEMESDVKVKALTSSIEPIMMIILGVGVALLMVAIIMPIYNLTNSF